MRINNSISATLDSFVSSAQAAVLSAASRTTAPHISSEAESQKCIDELQQALDAKFSVVLESLANRASEPSDSLSSRQELEELRHVMEEQFKAHDQTFGQAIGALSSSLQAIQTNIAHSSTADRVPAPNTREEIDAIKTNIENRFLEFGRQMNTSMQNVSNALQGISTAQAHRSTAAGAGSTTASRRTADGNEADGEEDPLDLLPRNNRAPQPRNPEVNVLQVRQTGYYDGPQ